MLKKHIITLTVGMSALLLGACNSQHSEPNVELIQDLMVTPAVKAQRPDDTAPNGIGNRVPPEHTVPVGFEPYKYHGDPEGSAKNPNPLAGNMSPEVLVVGQKLYETNCGVCHGMTAKGDGPVAAKMPLKPPMLNSDKVKGWTDGRIYHVITEGQGVMGPYASHIPQKYRWQVVNYIRHLQKN